MSSFTHLHVHSQYSILDGAASVVGLVKKARDCGMTAIALTDHGNMCGIKPFHEAAIKNGIKPILGIEAYVARRNRHLQETKEDRSGYHLIILAKNHIGYHNLLHLSSASYIDGFYFKPRIDRELLEKYSEGLIVSSACLGGEIPKKIMAGDIEGAKESIKWYKRVFGDDYYLEIMRHESDDPTINERVYKNQKLCNAKIIELGKELGVKVIATNDVHFLNEEDADAHDLLICLNMQKDLDDPNRMRYTKKEYLRTGEEMKALFADVPKAIENTMEIAEKIEEFELNIDPLMPDFPLPENFNNEDDYLRHLTYEGARMRWGDNLPEEITERLDFELETIKKMGYPGYFLIVWDFIKAAREMGVIVGPGRGSAAGSAVAYCIQITNIDPLKYNLLFERFLNPDRISMPDVDIDFEDDGRQPVVDWVVKKYGHERVSKIITFGTMAAKGAIRDVARVLKLPLSEANKLAKMVPDDPKINLQKAFEHVPDLAQEKQSENPLIAKTLKYAEALEGSVRQTGAHACGLIIGKDPLAEHIPVRVDKDSGLLLTQYDGKYVESVGMLKMDFLGLKNLSIIKDTLSNIKLSKGIDVDIDHISLEDEKTFELFSKGETTAVFQFESAGMKKHLRSLRPNRFEDLIAMNALYRPGPMKHIPTFIRRKNGQEQIIYEHPIMENFLKETYGVTVYQEQVMLQSRALAGFTRGMSDSLRKAMGKKILSMMDQLKLDFEKGCLSNPEFMEVFKGNTKKANQVIEKIWSDWTKFAEYAFNKSHSVCYAFIAYQTGYLKANYPAEYMAAVLSRNLSDSSKIHIFMDECRRMGLKTLGPDVNESYSKFTVNSDGNIRFGMAAIKGVGENAVENIIEERKNGPYKDVFNFIERIHLGTTNKRTLENLIIAGGLDSFGLKRSQYFEQDQAQISFLEHLIKYGNKIRAERESPQQSLFGNINGHVVSKPRIPECEEWNKLERLRKEKELIGIYLSAHPLDRFELEIKSFCNTNFLELSENFEKFENKEVRIAGIISDVRHAKSKNGNPCSFIKVEDFFHTHEFAFFGKDFVKFNQFCVEDLSVFIKGRVQKRRWPIDSTELELKINSIELLSEFRKTHVKQISLEIANEDLNDHLICEIEEHCKKNTGSTILNFILSDENDIKVKMFSRAYKVKLSKELTDYFENNSQITFKIN